MNWDAGLSPCAGSVRWVEYPVLGPRVRGGLLREPGLGLSGLAFEGLSGGAPLATAGVSTLLRSRSPRRLVRGSRSLGWDCIWGLSTIQNVHSVVVLSLLELFSL